MAQFFFFEGPLGSGKTFLMSVLAHNWQAKSFNRGGNIRLFSNYGLKESHEMNHYKDWYEVADAQGSICCFDEAQTSFDARQWGKTGNTYATHLLMYARKMKAIQMFCSPSINNVDSRLRQIVEVLVSCRRIGEKGFSYTFWDYQTKTFMHKNFLPMWKARMLMKLNLYDTYAMVQGFPLPNTDREAMTFFTELEKVHNEARRREGRLIVV